MAFSQLTAVTSFHVFMDPSYHALPVHGSYSSLLTAVICKSGLETKDMCWQQEPVEDMASAEGQSAQHGMTKRTREKKHRMNNA